MINVQFIFPQYLDVLLSPIRVCFIIRFLWNHDSAGSKRNLLQSCNYESNLCYFHNTGRELLKTEIKINSTFDQAGLQVPFCKEKEVLKSKYHCSSSSVGKYNFHFFFTAGCLRLSLSSFCKSRLQRSSAHGTPPGFHFYCFWWFSSFWFWYHDLQCFCHLIYWLLENDYA